MWRRELKLLPSYAKHGGTEAQPSQTADKSSWKLLKRNFNSVLDLNIRNIMNKEEHLGSHMQLLFYLSAQDKTKLLKIASVQIQKRSY